MPGDPTTKHGFPTMDGSDLGQTIDDTFNDLVEMLDDLIAAQGAGTLAARPTSTTGSPGKSGRMYLTTDTGVTYLDTGIGWIALNEPIGHVSWWAGTGDPPGGTHLKADGRPILRASYPLYWSIINDLHGAGNGTTTVNIPDLVERFPLGSGPNAGRVPNSPSAVGQSGGEERHTLTAAETPASGDRMTDQGLATGGLSITVVGPPVAAFDNNPRYSNVHQQNPGGGGAHNNMPPYLALTPIVRVA